MLDSVASGKKLPEKNILVLGTSLQENQKSLTNTLSGGTTESQREFLEALAVEDGRKTQDRHGSKQPPIANNFALGYTYQDVLDADHEGMGQEHLSKNILIVFRHSCPPLDIPSGRPFALLYASPPTPFDSSNYSQYTHCYFTRLVTAMVLAQRTSRLGTTVANSTDLVG
jgi:hypothetical protein